MPVTRRILFSLFAILVAAAAGPIEARPLSRPPSAPFGMRHDPIDGRQRFHRGIDVPAVIGAPVLAAADGIVHRAGPSGGYGLMVEIDHADGYRTRYAHLSRLNVKAGDRVAVGSVIGHVGSTGRSTGPHLHFEYWVAGRAVDPMPYFGRDAVAVGRSKKDRNDVAAHMSDYAMAKQAAHHGDTADALPMGDGL